MPDYKILFTKILRQKLVLIRFLSVALSFAILTLITNTYNSELYGQFLGFHYSVILISLLFSESITNTFLIKYIEIKKIKIHSITILLFVVSLVISFQLKFSFTETFFLLVYIFFSKYSSIILRFKNLHEVGFFFENTLRNLIFFIILLLPFEVSIMTNFLIANIFALLFYASAIMKFEDREAQGLHFYELPRSILVHQTIFSFTGRGIEVLPITILGHIGSYGYVVILEIVTKFTRLIAFPLQSYAYEFAIKVKTDNINLDDYKNIQKKSLISAFFIFVMAGLGLFTLLHYKFLGDNRIADVISAFLILGLSEVVSSYTGPSGVFLNMSERFKQIYLARLLSSFIIFGLILNGNFLYVVVLIALSKLLKNITTYLYTRKELCHD